MSNHRVLVTSGSSHVRTVQEIFMQRYVAAFFETNFLLSVYVNCCLREINLL